MAHASSRRNAFTGLVLAGVVAGMVGLAFAAVPLYDLFRQASGFGGKMQVAAVAPRATVDRTLVIRFNADVDPKLPWAFLPNQRQVSVLVGETAVATFTARNLGNAPATGTATFNVTPLKAGKYFSKVRCFCSGEQRLAAGQEAEMKVRFFIDPAIMDDRNLDEVKTITLSYTFFRTRQDNRQAAAEQSGVRTIN
jgi:cytochrome c oxidase assembly protein subunit 11